MLKTEYAEAMFSGYVEAMLWSTTDTSSGDESADASFADNGYDADDIDPEFEAVCRADILSFVATAWPWLTRYSPEPGEGWEEMSPTQAGHDLWLTRNHHGAGFWGRGLGNRGDVLTTKAQRYAEVDPHTTAAGKVTN